MLCSPLAPPPKKKRLADREWKIPSSLFWLPLSDQSEFDPNPKAKINGGCIALEKNVVLKKNRFVANPVLGRKKTNPFKPSWCRISSGFDPFWEMIKFRNLSYSFVLKITWGSVWHFNSLATWISQSVFWKDINRRSIELNFYWQKGFNNDQTYSCLPGNTNLKHHSTGLIAK